MVDCYINTPLHRVRERHPDIVIKVSKSPDLGQYMTIHAERLSIHIELDGALSLWFAYDTFGGRDELIASGPRPMEVYRAALGYDATVRGA